LFHFFWRAGGALPFAVEWPELASLFLAFTVGWPPSRCPLCLLHASAALGTQKYAASIAHAPMFIPRFQPAITILARSFANYVKCCVSH
jgi:hypothetical protein